MRRVTLWFEKYCNCQLSEWICNPLLFCRICIKTACKPFVSWFARCLTDYRKFYFFNTSYSFMVIILVFSNFSRIRRYLSPVIR